MVNKMTEEKEVVVTKNEQICVLAVDDDPFALELLTTLLNDKDCRVLTATNGREACEIINQEKTAIDVILIDRQMPEMNGLEVVNLIKGNAVLKNIPIIMATGANNKESMIEGIAAGVFYYMTKPLDKELFDSVFSSAAFQAKQQKTLKRELAKHREGFNVMQSGTFYVKTLEDAENLACFIANCFPEPQRVVSGCAELIINAVEHGNLGIGYDEKSDLIANDNWREEINSRQLLPENQEKKVVVSFKRIGNKYSLQINDQGEGFDWRSFMRIDPARATHTHGRGIARANMVSFSEITYNEKGNQVTATFSPEEAIDWTD